MSDILLTWPKTRSLSGYLASLVQAREDDKLIFFRVPSKPNVKHGDRAYMVYDGYVRGYSHVIAPAVVNASDIVNPGTGEVMGEGLFVVRSPMLFPMPYEGVCGDPFRCHDVIGKYPMKGFRSFRYLKEGMGLDSLLEQPV